MLTSLAAVMGSLLLALGPDRAAAVDVFVDFTSDFHDGDSSDDFVNGSDQSTPNGVADWIDELNQGAQDAGVPIFTSEERAFIETRVIEELERIFAGTTLQFVTEEPSGLHEVIYMARDDDNPDLSSTNFGSATVDLFNRQTRPYSSNQDADPSSVARVTTANIASSAIESSDSRSRQLQEFTTSLAGTAAHELGHVLGLLHHYVYSAPGISPANYNNTGSRQNDFILATGDTGISETERETPRTLSPFSRVMLDVAGGSQSTSGSVENDALAPGGAILSDRTENNGFSLGTDAGATISTAQALSFTTGELSGQEISFIEGDIDGNTADVDTFSFSTPVDAILTAHVFSERLSFGSDEFDPVLALLDADGNTLFEVDDLAYDDDDYVDPGSPEDTEDDPFLANIPLEAGEYYLRVSPATEDVSDIPSIGDIYYLVTALILDEDSLLAGDYNNDGVVDAADYTVWRDTLGEEVNPRFGGADGDGSGVIDLADYELWAQNFGQTATGFASVPEPATGVGLMVLGVCCLARRLRQHH
ncbi:MAG: PEP-CTERM sorting domain-containing protein [Planctomycetota bacterium]